MLTSCSTWYKTLSNCYVPGAQIEPVDAALDDCGPIPFMNFVMRQPDVDESEPTSTTGFAVRDDTRSNKRWLYLTQIGYDSADCLGEANSASKSEDVYSYGDYIIVQCATRSENPADESQ